MTTVEPTTLLNKRLVEASAYQMLEKGQGYFQIIDYKLLVDLAWYSDADQHWHCAFSFGEEETPFADLKVHSFEVTADDVEALEDALYKELQSAS